MPLEISRDPGRLYIQQGWGVRLLRRTSYGGQWNMWQLETTWGNQCRVRLLNGGKFFHRFRNFRRLWRFGWRPESKYWATPFFAIQRYDNCISIAELDCYLTGWVIAVWPHSWLLDFEDRFPLYRQTWDMTTREYTELP